jgi:hypothetical protein
MRSPEEYAKGRPDPGGVTFKQSYEAIEQESKLLKEQAGGVEKLWGEYRAGAESSLAKLGENLDSLLEADDDYQVLRSLYEQNKKDNVDEHKNRYRFRQGTSRIIDSILDKFNLSELKMESLLEKRRKEAIKAQRRAAELDLDTPWHIQIPAGVASGFSQLGRDPYEQFGFASSIAGGVAATMAGAYLGLPMLATGALALGLGYLGDVSPVLLRRNKLKEYRELLKIPYTDDEYWSDFGQYSLSSAVGVGIGFSLPPTLKFIRSPVKSYRALGEVSANAMKYAGNTRVGKKLNSYFRDIELQQFNRNTDPAVLGNPKAFDDISSSSSHGDTLNTGMNKIQKGEKLTDDDIPLTKEEFNTAAESAGKNADDPTIDGSRARDLARFVEEKTPEQIAMEKKAKINKARAGEAESKASKLEFPKDKETGDIYGEFSDGSKFVIKKDTELPADQRYSLFFDPEGGKLEIVDGYRTLKEAKKAANEINLTKQKENLLPHGSEAPDVATVPQFTEPPALKVKRPNKGKSAKVKMADGKTAVIKSLGNRRYDLEIDGKKVRSFEGKGSFEDAKFELNRLNKEGAETAFREGSEAQTRTLSEYERQINPELAPISNEQAQKFLDDFADGREFDAYTEAAVNDVLREKPDFKVDVDGQELPIKEAIESIKTKKDTAIESATTCGIGTLS